MSEENKKLVHHSIEQINRGDISKFNEGIDSRFQDVFGDVAKRARAAFPDMRLKVEDQIAEGDKVVTRWSLAGTHTGDSKHSRLGAVKATGKKVHLTGITIHRIKDGKIVESWGEVGKLEALEQLGLVDNFAKVVHH